MTRRRSGLPDLPPVEPVRAGGVTLAVRRLTPEAGGGASPLRLIAFHGGPGLDHHVLLPLGLLLAERYEVWLPDLPGHGASPPAGGEADLTLRRLQERMERWLAGLPGPPGVLLGHSLAAWLLQEWLTGPRSRGAVTPPAAAVLVSPPAAGQERRGTALRRAGTLMRSSRAPRAPKASPGRGAGARARKEVRAHVEAETRGRSTEVFLEALERGELRDPRGYGRLQADLHRRLVGPVRRRAPGCPVLVLCGEEDRTTPAAQARRVAEALDGARLRFLPGTGHYPFADALEPTAHAIREFLDPLLP
ncbi:MAG: alpha/beta fold hydrolase [Thermoanaerobaculia bacterium]